MIRLSLLSLCVFSGFATAQTSTSIFVPDNNASTGGGNVIPMGQGKSSSTWRNQKYQMLIPASFAKKVPIRINDLGFAPSSTNLHNFDSIVIKIDVIKASTLSTTFAKNLSTKAVTVLSAKNYTWHLAASKWTRIGIQKPFLWIPTLGNLVIDIEVHGAGGLTGNTGGFRRGSTIERLFSVGWTTNPPATGSKDGGSIKAALKIELVSTDADARPFGQGCAGSNGTPAMSYVGQPQIGKTFTINLKNAVQSSVALHLVGLNSAAPIFPIKLAALGAPGCNLFISPDFAFSSPTLKGSVTQKMPIPNNSSLVGGRYWDQFLILDKKANKLGFVLSNHGRVLIGK